ncbi:membrane fusion protein, cobalt-zinc-cadmium efflux system [Daejeonella rubra]|uniref:Membrane fusion protein, cobalt-zinc-cadmium efflux system n=1 Tax=Daejeonella rubra TaxID=990371 RepID=A0A1G9SIT9_9SPHI|nr:efflux RND transporter periplasmic adaptor subunit [Daejeonella rubra]SDM35312.1 membrane fusion protein, cobalt-zinc-cadmium efflux system [Daejeonella rubra]
MKNIFILTFAFLITACGTSTKEEVITEGINANENLVTLSDAQLKSAGLVLGKLEEKALSSVIITNGTIDVPPQNMISVSIPLGGYLKSTKLLPGLQIRKGEVIAVMEDQQYIQLQQDYLTTKARLAFSKSEFERQKELNASKASSDKVFQQIQMEYNTQRISLSSLDQKLRMININPGSISESNISRTIQVYSPINGFVSKVNVNIGKFVNPSDVLFELIDPSSIHLNLKIFEKDLNKLSLGQKLVAYTNNQPDKKYAGEISLISRDLSSERTAEVHCHFENADKSLAPGMYMNAEIEVKSNKTLAIAEEAIVNFEGIGYVFVQKTTKEFEMVPVETGTSENGFIEVINKDKFNGKQIVIKGAYTLLMALKNKSEE